MKDFHLRVGIKRLDEIIRYLQICKEDELVREFENYRDGVIDPWDMI